jgi:hypothetical protein
MEPSKSQPDLTLDIYNVAGKLSKSRVLLLIHSIQAQEHIYHGYRIVTGSAGIYPQSPKNNEEDVKGKSVNDYPITTIPM